MHDIVAWKAFNKRITEQDGKRAFFDFVRSAQEPKLRLCQSVLQKDALSGRNKTPPKEPSIVGRSRKASRGGRRAVRSISYGSYLVHGKQIA